MKPRLVVAFDKGAVTLGELSVALPPLADVLFVVAGSEHAQAMLPLLEEIGDTVAADQPYDDLVAALRRWSPDGITTYSERMVEPAARLASSLGLAFHTPATAALLRDKHAQRQRLREAGVQATASFVVMRPSDWPAALAEVGLPAVVKPRRGEGSQHTHLVQDAGSGARLVEQLLAEPSFPLVVEEYLSGRRSEPFGDYVSVETAVRNGDVRHLAVTGKFPLLEPFRELGHFWPAHLDERERSEILELTTDALTALGVATGVVHSEVKLTPDGPRLIEVNGRVGGMISELAKRACGADLAGLVARIALAAPADCRPLVPARVFFQYHNAPPPAATRLESIDGMADVRRVPGVTSYTSYVRPPAQLPGGVVTTWFDALCGDADDHAGMLAVLDEALQRMSFSFTGPDGRLTLGADQLRCAPGPTLAAAVEGPIGAGAS